MSSKKDIRTIKEKDLTNFLEDHKIPLFRVQQLNEWLWKKRAISFKEMTNLSIQDRSLLENSFDIKALKIHDSQISNDGTRKYSMKLHDNKLIESVIIPSRKRLTACISSQVGCSLSCNFCATGKLDLMRNLTYAEIYDQVFLLNEESHIHYGKKLTNIVFMGMGEPLLNYNNLIQSISLITGKKGLEFSPKRITVSTVGIAKMIKQLADDEVKFNLAISLHTAISEKRSEIMPINDSIPLKNLRDSIHYFYKKTGIRPTYEYILFDKKNDSLEDAEELAKFCKISPCKINLIEYNCVDGIDFKKSGKNQTHKFITYLENKNLIVNLRKSKGKDIDAACGQLINKLQ